MNHRMFFLMSSALAVVSGAFLLDLDSARREHDTWTQFSVTHNCKLVEQAPEQSSSGVVVMLTPDARPMLGQLSMSMQAKEAYQCDDGVTYWRKVQS